MYYVKFLPPKKVVLYSAIIYYVCEDLQMSNSQWCRPIMTLLIDVTVDVINQKLHHLQMTIPDVVYKNKIRIFVRI